MPYITVDSDCTAIYGTGDTAESSWQDTMRQLGYTEADLIPEGDEAPFGAVDLRRSHFHTMPATAGLVERVEAEGGNIVWDVVDGVACVAEE